MWNKIINGDIDLQKILKEIKILFESVENPNDWSRSWDSPTHPIIFSKYGSAKFFDVEGNISEYTPNRTKSNDYIKLVKTKDFIKPFNFKKEVMYNFNYNFNQEGDKIIVYKGERFKLYPENLIFIDKDKIGEHYKYEGGNLKPVKQYTKEGKFVAEHPSISQVARDFNIPYTKLLFAMKTVNCSYKGYIWRYARDEHGPDPKNPVPVIPINKDHYIKSRKPILEYDLNGNLIRRFEKVTDAIKEYNIKDKICVYSILRGEKYAYKGKIFRYENEELRGSYDYTLVTPKVGKIIQSKLDGTFIRTYKSYKEAAKATGLIYVEISRACNGKRDSYGGFLWKIEPAKTIY